MTTEELQKQFNKEFTEQAIVLDKYMSKCHELEQQLSACEIVLEDTQKELEETKNKSLKWVNINYKLPPEHDLVLTLDATGALSLSRYVSNDFPNGVVLWAEIELPK